MYSLGKCFVSGICVWIPCMKEKMVMMRMMMIIRIIIIKSSLENKPSHNNSIRKNSEIKI
jgi:hypothetical protein